MTANVFDIGTRRPFEVSEPDELPEPLPESPQPPAEYTEAEQRAWWDGWTAHHNHEERRTAAALVDSGKFIHQQLVRRGLRPLYPAS